MREGNVFTLSSTLGSDPSSASDPVSFLRGWYPKSCSRSLPSLPAQCPFLSRGGVTLVPTWLAEWVPQRQRVVPSGRTVVGYRPHPRARTGVSLTQYTPRAVCLMRFHGGGLSCYNFCLHFWWLIRVTLVVDWWVLPQNFGPMVGTYEGLLWLC